MKLLWPVFNGKDKISQKFGETIIDYSKWGLKGHNGIDIWGAIGLPIMSVADGTLKKIGHESDGFGNYIVLDHGEYTSLYAHLSEIMINTIGQKVMAGEVIGKMGSTGNSTGPHLHFGLRLASGYDVNNGYGGYENPLPYLIDSINETEVVAPIKVVEESEDIEISNVSEGKVKIVCDMARVRLVPGTDGNVLGNVYKDTEFISTGKRENINNITWRQVCVWIAENDGYGTQIIQDV
jgi:murein DD-endopeptidase MepM/ murein hydrolase activator NlpD